MALCQVYLPIQIIVQVLPEMVQVEEMRQTDCKHMSHLLHYSTIYCMIHKFVFNMLDHSYKNCNLINLLLLSLLYWENIYLYGIKLAIHYYTTAYESRCKQSVQIHNIKISL